MRAASARARQSLPALALRPALLHTHSHPFTPTPTRTRSSLGSYFAPWMSVTVSTFESPFQTFLLEFSVGIVHYACWGEFCSPQDYKASYSVFMNFWYTQVNNGGFAPYPNITPASGDPGNTATALAALGCACAPAASCRRSSAHAPRARAPHPCSHTSPPTSHLRAPQASLASCASWPLPPTPRP